MKSLIFNTHDVILLMTAFQCGTFGALLLIVRRKRRLTNIFLALFLFQYAAIPLDVLIRFGAEFRHLALRLSPDLFHFFGFGYWLEGPLLLWYTRSLVDKNYTLRLQDLWYLLPFFVYLIYAFTSYYSLEIVAKRQFQDSFMAFRDARPWNYIAIFRDIFRVSMGVLCLAELRRYGRYLQHKYSNIEKRELNWLRLLVIGFLIVRSWSVVVVCLAMLAMTLKVNTNFWVIGLAGNYLTFLLVSLLVFHGLGHSLVVERSDTHPEANNEAEQKKRFKPEQIAYLATHMENEKPYLEPDLTLEKLAAQLRMTPRTLSNIINRHFKCNFFEFINSYRIEDAMGLLRNDETASKNMTDIMYDAGFRSKTSFNTLFKKKVGISPSEYRKSSARKN